jgi:hypothetical protein
MPRLRPLSLDNRVISLQDLSRTVSWLFRDERYYKLPMELTIGRKRHSDYFANLLQSLTVAFMSIIRAIIKRGDNPNPFHRWRDVPGPLLEMH